MSVWSNTGIEFSELRDQDHHSVTVCLPGVLYDGFQQFVPVADVLPGMSYACNYTTHKFDFDHLVGAVCRFLIMPVARDMPINLIGGSLGGMLVPFVVERLREVMPKYDVSRITTVLFDPPCGLPSLANPLAKPFKSRLVTEVVANFVAAFNLDFPVFESALPKLEEITGVFDDPSISRKQTVRYVRNATREGMLGQSLARFARQAHCISEKGADGSLERACRALDGATNYYVDCRMGDNPIKRQMAMDWWGDHVEFRKVLHRDAVHIGFLQNRLMFANLLEDIFACRV